MFEIRGKYTTAKVMIDDVEEQCVAQITSMVNHPAFTNPMSIMPDTHSGKGSVIGLSMPLGDKIIPNIIGADISCGMLAINIGKSIPMKLSEIDHKIRKAIPFGFNVHNNPILNMEKDFPWKEVDVEAHKFSLAYNQKFGTNIYHEEKYNFNWFEKKCKTIHADLGRIIKSIGTFGGGNHFCEFGHDGNDDYWFVIHTGSRNFGKCVCDYWQNMASKVIRDAKNEEFRNRIEEIRENYKGMEIKKKIKEARKELGLDTFGNDKLSKDLQWLEGEDAHGYLYDMIFAQKYAEVNRAYIAKVILNILKVDEVDRIETVHNFIDFRDFIVRKGAIRSYAGERMIVPFNMRDGILICEGKSNEEWNCSAPHGAGRLMSRSQAKKKLKLEDFESQMDGIYSTSVVHSTLDEAPGAYKDASVIEKAIEPTANILLKIKPIINMKDNGKKRKF
ncbi:MAG: RtcB family protein [Petrotogales bacterium]